MLATQPVLSAQPCTQRGSVAARSCSGVRGLRLSGPRRTLASRSPACVSADASKWKVVAPKQVNALINDKGYTFLDIRSGAEYRSGNKLHWIHLPLAEIAGDGRPVMNPKFVELFDKKFKNKISRVIIACDDGGSRSEKAAELVTDLGYTAIITVEGGIDAYLAEFPLEEKDKKARVMRVQQEVGVKYGGTGVTDASTPDDSA